MVVHAVKAGTPGLGAVTDGKIEPRPPGAEPRRGGTRFYKLKLAQSGFQKLNSLKRTAASSSAKT